MTSFPRIQQLARRGRVWWWLGLFIVAFGILGAVSTGIRGHFGGWPLRADERVLLFSTTARLTDDGSTWLVPIHGWVFEPETDDAARGVALAAVKQALRLDPSSSPAALLEERLRWFLADNQRGKRVVVRVAGMERAFGPTDPDGHFRDSILVPAEVAAKFARGGTLGLEATSPAGPVTATVLMPAPSGLSVISDIDDTVKVSEVLRQAGAPAEHAAFRVSPGRRYVRAVSAVLRSRRRLSLRLVEPVAALSAPGGLHARSTVSGGHLRASPVSLEGWWRLRTAGRSTSNQAPRHRGAARCLSGQTLLSGR